MMSAKMITLAIDAVVLYSMNELRMPRAKAARTVPLMLPGRRSRRREKASIR